MIPHLLQESAKFAYSSPEIFAFLLSQVSPILLQTCAEDLLVRLIRDSFHKPRLQQFRSSNLFDPPVISAFDLVFCDSQRRKLSVFIASVITNHIQVDWRTCLEFCCRFGDVARVQVILHSVGSDLGTDLSTYLPAARMNIKYERRLGLLRLLGGSNKYVLFFDFYRLCLAVFLLCFLTMVCTSWRPLCVSVLTCISYMMHKSFSRAALILVLLISLDNISSNRFSVLSSLACMAHSVVVWRLVCILGRQYQMWAEFALMIFNRVFVAPVVFVSTKLRFFLVSLLFVALLLFDSCSFSALVVVELVLTSSAFILLMRAFLKAKPVAKWDSSEALWSVICLISFLGLVVFSTFIVTLEFNCMAKAACVCVQLFAITYWSIFIMHIIDREKRRGARNLSQIRI